MDRIYLDANATTPLDPRVRDAMLPWLDCGNPSSAHAEGRRARDAVETARERVAALIGAHAREIHFTSGGTESNAMALGAAGGGLVVCSAVEHPSVLRAARRERLRVHPVRADGVADPIEPPPGAALVSLMLANNETGALQPVSETAALARAAGALAHTDAVQACGKIEVDVETLGIDLLSLSAHKMHGPKGAGALYVRRGARAVPLWRGGEQERGLRPGTENVAAIVGLGAAADLAREELHARRARWLELGEACERGLREHGARVLSPRARIPNTICACIAGIEAEALVMALDLAGFAVSTGSACASGAAEPSHVLVAMGLSREEVAGGFRVSMHAGTTARDVRRFLSAFSAAVKSLRAASS